MVDTIFRDRQGVILLIYRYSRDKYKMLKNIMDLPEAEKKREMIRRFMETYELTVGSWCSIATMSPNTLYSFLNGKTNDITYGTLQKLARAMGVTVGTIMGEIGLPETQAPPLKPQEEDILRRIRALGPTQQKMLSDMLKDWRPPSRHDHR